MVYRYTYLIDLNLFQVYSQYYVTNKIKTLQILIDNSSMLDLDWDNVENIELIEVAKIKEPNYWIIPNFNMTNPTEISYGSISIKNSTQYIYVLVYTKQGGGISIFSDLVSKPLEYSKYMLVEDWW